VKSKKPRRPKFVPKVKKRHAAKIMADEPDAWRAFSEGCLRNRYFHEQVLGRGAKCLSCNRRFNREEAKNPSKIDKHHESYIRLCIGGELPEKHDDVYREAKKGEFDRVPDCRQCHKDNPDYFHGCLKLIFPLHHACHGRVHERERWYLDTWKAKLLDDFKGRASAASQPNMDETL
jgi:hypothetical protein